MAETTQKQGRWHTLTLAEYVQRRNGVPLGHADSLRNMLYRSFGASSFAKFWQYWNPIWGYGLGRFIYSPLRRVFSPVLALILTFSISGGIHDLATMLVRGSVAFLFTPWFFLLSLGVAAGNALHMDSSRLAWHTRMTINLAYLMLGLALTLIIKRTFSLP